MAVVPMRKEEVDYWQVYLINFSEHPLTTVLVSSKGFGKIEGKEKETATMRHHIELIAPKSFQPVEGMLDDLAALTNEFFVSFYSNGKLYDKKFVFVAESIAKKHFTDIPILEQQGVMIV